MPVEVEPASFRDPSGTVFYRDGRVLRGLGPEAARDWEALTASGLLDRLVQAGRAVPTSVAVDADLTAAEADRWPVVLEHEAVPFVSYPYEWTFEMLRDAAVLHLEVLVEAIDAGITTKDGYAYNVQWRGAAPVFIDIGSFERLGGGPWRGYRQFCRTFLYPLLLEAHADVPFQRFLFGHLDGFQPRDMRRLLGGSRMLRRGVLRHVVLHSFMESKVAQGSEALGAELTEAGFDAELQKATVRNLLGVVEGLRSKRSTSGWATYRTTCSYSDDDTAAKRRFVADLARQARPGVVWDLGCNDGAFSRLVAEHARYVVAADADDVVVDSLYRSLRGAAGPTNVLPLVVDLVDPAPARGWRGLERQAFTGRGRPDLVLALALVHHLAIGANVPLAQVVDWLADLDATVVVEFVDRHDAMVQRLLANKPRGTHDDYRADVFEQLLAARFDVLQREPLPGGSRTMHVARPRR